MKNLLLILHLPPPVHGSSVMGKFVHDSKIVNETFNSIYINLGTSEEFDNIGKFQLNKVFRYASIIFKVLWELLFFRPDACYFAITVKGVAFYKDALIVLLVKAFRVKLIYHFHNKGVAENQNRFLINLIYNFIFKNSSVILLSKNLYSDIKKYVSQSSIYICPNGIPKIPKSFRRTKQDLRKVNILFFSNLNKLKGVYDLLDACKILKEKQIDFECTFAGGFGDIDKQEFESKLADHSLNDIVHYAGKMFGDDKHTVFNNADIFAFPTRFETFGIVNLEAMQHGLPVVSTLEGGIPDVVINGETGYLVPKGDPKAFANQLEILIKNSKTRLKMGERGAKRFNQLYTIDKFEYKMYHILKDFLNKT